MIHILYHSSPDDKKDYFKSVKSAKDLWLVSHLEAKRTIQNTFLAEHNILSSRAVQRASEYWHWLFSINCPDWSVVSKSLIYVWIEEWFAEQDIEDEYKDIALFYNFFEQFLPVLSQSFSGEFGDSQKDLFAEWVGSEPSRKERLSGWYQQAEKFWLLLNEKKSLPRPWLLSILLKKENINFAGLETLYVDLGSDIQQLEVELLLRISENHQVNVLIPRQEWSEEYQTAFSVYKKLIEQSAPGEELPRKSLSPKNIRLAEFPSVVREVKAAVGQVREWLASGIPITQIAVLSPHIEEYWDLMREHLIVEGVPMNKRYQAKVVSLPFVQTWLSRLHLLQDEIHSADVENYLFDPYKIKQSPVSYEDFKTNYSFLYEKDLTRKKLNLPPMSTGEIPLEEFIKILYREWPIEITTVIDRIADQLVSDQPLNIQFSLNLWLKYLELIISMETKSSEWTVVAAEESGLVVANVSDVDWTELSHALVLGCTQSALREQLKSPALAQDIFALENDLGLVLNRVEQTKQEFDLRWFLEKPLKDCFLLRSHTDFEGQPQTASSFWLSLEKEHKVPLQKAARWDRLMEGPWESSQSEFAFDPAENAVIQHKLDLEVRLDNYKTIKVPGPLSVSASSLSNMDQCGFKYYADKVLKIDEPRVYDLDIDLMYQGQLLHAILEEIGKRAKNSQDNLDFSPREIDEIYSVALKAVASEVQAQNFWLFEKERHLQFILNFIEMEKAWRQQFPKTKILATEADLQGYVGVVNEAVVFSKEQQSPEQFRLRGKIDRIDQDSQGNLGLVDYKSSHNAAHLKALPSWAENGQFQMPLYALAVEQGLLEGIEPRTVAAAGYMFLKDKKRGHGYILNDMEHELGDTAGRSAQNVSREEKDRVFGEILEVMKVCLQKIARGEFPPLPKTFKVCETCNWSRVCRAPHLR